MKYRQIIRHVITIEFIGFGIVILFIWLNELIDIPHYLFRQRATPINYTECIFETVMVMTLAVFVLGVTIRLMNRITYLEGFLCMCASCKKIRHNGQWIPLELFIGAHSEAEFSHGLCPECMEIHYGIILNKSVPYRV